MPLNKNYLELQFSLYMWCHYEFKSIWEHNQDIFKFIEYKKWYKFFDLFFESLSTKNKESEPQDTVMMWHKVQSQDVFFLLSVFRNGPNLNDPCF